MDLAEQRRYRNDLFGSVVGLVFVTGALVFLASRGAIGRGEMLTMVAVVVGLFVLLAVVPMRLWAGSARVLRVSMPGEETLAPFPLAPLSTISRDGLTAGEAAFLDRVSTLTRADLEQLERSVSGRSLGQQLLAQRRRNAASSPLQSAIQQRPKPEVQLRVRQVFREAGLPNASQAVLEDALLAVLYRDAISVEAFDVLYGPFRRAAGEDL